MKQKCLLIFFLLFFSCSIFAKKCDSYDSQADMDSCWLGKLNAIEQEMNNKYKWILYWTMNAIYVEEGHPTQAAIDDFNKYSIPMNAHLRKAHELFIEYRNETCTAAFVESSEGDGRDLAKTMCLYTLTKSYIADLEDQFFPQGWQEVYQDYFKKKKSVSHLNHRLNAP